MLIFQKSLQPPNLPGYCSILLLTLFCIPAAAQNEELPFLPTDTAQLQAGKFDWSMIGVDNELTRSFNTTQRLITAGEVLQAAVAAQSLLEYPHDFPLLGQNKFSTTRSFLHNWLEQQPGEFLQAYETQFNAQAIFLLEEYERTREPKFLAEANRRYLHTSAGCRATYVLASRQFDQGNFLAALRLFLQIENIPRLLPQFLPQLKIQQAICYRKLQRPQLADRVLTDFFNSRSSQTVRWREQEFQYSEIVELLTHLDEQEQTVPVERLPTGWPQFRHSSDRRRESQAFHPVPFVDWSCDLVAALLPDDLPQPEMITSLNAFLIAQLNNEDYTWLPAWNPITTEDSLIVSGLGTIAAFDKQTGQLQWKSVTDDAALRYLQNEELLARYPVYRPGEIDQLHHYLIQQLIGDLTEGTISSDGRQVYSLRGGGVLNTDRRAIRFNENIDAVPLVMKSFNVLAAHDARSGEFRWQIGTIQGGEQAEFSEHYFLGVPLAVEGQLFVLSEHGEHLHLSELNTATGQPLWMQKLAIPFMSIHEEQPRRIAGPALSWQAPYLLVSTSSGTLFAYDVVAREIVWSFIYKEKNPHEEDRISPFRNNRQVHSAEHVNLLNGSRWQESAPVVQGSQVLATPADSQDLFCLDLLEGQQLWTEPREDGFFIEAVAGNRVLVVGRHKIRCLDSQTGQRLWSTPYAGYVPAGRGLLQGAIYHLPYRSAGILSFDTETGRLVAATELTGAGTVGNLLVDRGQLFACGEGQLTAFLSISALHNRINQQLAANPNDSQALMWRGQLALHQGDLQAGLEGLQQAYRTNPSPEVAQQLTRTLLSADFDQLLLDENQLSELSQLMVRAEHSTDILLKYLIALQKQGKTEQSLQLMKRILLSGSHRAKSVPVSAELQIRADRLINSQLHKMLAAGTPAQNAETLQFLKTELEQAESPAQLELLWPLFIDTPLEEVARWGLVATDTSQPLSPLARERHLLYLAETDDRAQALQAHIELSEIYLQEKSWWAAARSLQSIFRDYPEDVDRQGQTGRERSVQIARRLPESISRDLFAKTPDVIKLKPLDKRYRVQVDAARRTGGRNDLPRPVDANLKDHPVWKNWHFQAVKTEGQLTAYNHQQLPQWEWNHTESFAGAGEGTLHAEGHLAIFAEDGQLFALNTLSAAGANTTAVQLLWQQEFGQVGDETQPQFNFMESDATKTFGPTPLVIAWQNEVGEFVHCRDHEIIYREQSRLLMRDARDGTILWEYDTGVDSDGTAWADNEYVYHLFLTQKRATRYRRRDGQPVSGIELPRHDRLYALSEKYALFWRKLNAQSGDLFVFDLQTAAVIWNMETSGTISVAHCDQDLLTVLDLGRGQISFVRPRAENTLAGTLPAPETTARQMFITADADSYFIHLTSKPDAVTQPLAFYSLQDIHGPVLAVDRNSLTLRWKKTVEQTRWVPQQPSALPFLIYGTIAPVQAAGENAEINLLPQLKILDKRTGQTICEYQPGLLGRLVNVAYAADQQQTELNFQAGSLIIEQLD